jgi:hypothetical protein
MRGCVCHQQLYSAFGRPVYNNNPSSKVRYPFFYFFFFSFLSHSSTLVGIRCEAASAISSCTVLLGDQFTTIILAQKYATPFFYFFFFSYSSILVGIRCEAASAIGSCTVLLGDQFTTIILAQKYATPFLFFFFLLLFVPFFDPSSKVRYRFLLLFFSFPFVYLLTVNFHLRIRPATLSNGHHHRPYYSIVISTAGLQYMERTLNPVNL